MVRCSGWSSERLAKELNLFEVSYQPSAFSILLLLKADS